MRWFLLFQDVEKHRHETVNGVCVLTLFGLEALGIESIKRPKSQGMAIDE